MKSTRSACCTTSRVASHAAVGADDAGAERVRSRQAAFAADRGAHRRIQQRRERLQSVACAGDHDAAAADEHRRARWRSSIRAAAIAAGSGAHSASGIRAVTRLRPHLGRIDLLLLHVVGQPDVRGARAARWSLRGRRCAPPAESGPTRSMRVFHLVSGAYRASWSSSVSGNLPRDSRPRRRR